MTLNFFGRHPGRSLFLIGALGLFAGCAPGTAPNAGSAKVDYGTYVPPPLEVPPDLARPSANDTFTPAPVSPEKSKAAATATATATSGVLLPAVSGVRVERAGGQRWLVVQQAPAQVWTAIHDFLKENNLAVAAENPALGLIETDWAENRTKRSQELIDRAVSWVFPNLLSSGFKDKYRIRIEAGATAGTTEVYLTHQGQEQVAQEVDNATNIVWLPRSSDPELEAEMLRLLMLKLGVPDKAVEIALTATSPDRAQLVKDAQGSHLVLNDQEQASAWRMIGLVLDRLSVVVEERNAAQSTYRVRYTEPVKEEAPGFFGKMFGKATPIAANSEYEVSVAQANAGSEVRVTPKPGADPKMVTQILSWLHEQLK